MFEFLKLKDMHNNMTVVHVVDRVHNGAVPSSCLYTPHLTARDITLSITNE